MRRALMWFNVYGHEAVQHKLKNRLKMHFLCFLAVFELVSDSLTAIYVEPHQCPLHQSILLTQGPICEIFAKIFWELAILKISLFLGRPFQIFFFKFFFFFYFILMKISPNLYGRMDGSKFWCSPWFPENSLLCVILRYTVYVIRKGIWNLFPRLKGKN